MIMEPARRWSFLRYGSWIVIAVLAALIVNEFQPKTSIGRAPSRRAQCVNNMKQIILALANYESVNGRYPPASVAGPDGRPWHSWRILLLPFMEQNGLYQRYKFDEPWDGPNNIKLLPLTPQSYLCPEYGRVRPTGTGYVAITGPGSAFGDAHGLRHAQVLDKHSETIMVVEWAGEEIPWTSPVDLSLTTMSLRVNARNRPAISSRHSGGANVSFVDGGVRFLKNSVPPATVKSLMTIDAGDDPGRKF